MSCLGLERVHKPYILYDMFNVNVEKQAQSSSPRMIMSGDDCFSFKDVLCPTGVPEEFLSRDDN